ncbi:MAG: hypothetical protein WBF09_20645 [Candidatus Acidiferrum sp.]
MNETMNENELKHILDNPAASPEGRARARAALGVEMPETELPEAQRMLASLGKKHVSEITEDAWMAYFAKNHAPASEELIREWRYFVPPDDRTLELLTGQDRIGGLRWWWQTTLETCGERADVKALARERLAEL